MIKNSWNQIESYIFETYETLQGREMAIVGQ